jgi:hypothetical protein
MVFECAGCEAKSQIAEKSSKKEIFEVFEVFNISISINFPFLQLSFFIVTHPTPAHCPLIYIFQ